MAELKPGVTPGPRSLALDYEASGVTIKISSLDEYNHGIHGEVNVYIGKAALVKYETVNFSSQANISKLEKAIIARCEKYKLGDNIIWDQIWEDVRVRAIEYWRRGEPVESGFTNEDVQRPEYLIWPFIPRGQTTIFFAEPESFKTGFGLLFHGMVNLSWTTHPKLGIKLNLPPEGGSSLFLDNETRRNDALWQLKRIATGFGVEFPFEYRRMRRPLADEAEQIKERCDDLKVNFLIVDSLMRAAGGDVLKTETVNRLFDAVDYIGRTTLIMAHSPKNAEGEKTIYGNAFFQYLPRSVWEIKKVKEVDSDTMDVGFFHVKGNLSKKFPPRGYRLKFIEDGPITITPVDIDKTDLTQYMDLTHRILHLLKDGRPRSYQTIAEELAAKPKGVADQLSRMNHREQVLNIGGSWVLRAAQNQ